MQHTAVKGTHTTAATKTQRPGESGGVPTYWETTTCKHSRQSTKLDTTLQQKYCCRAKQKQARTAADTAARAPRTLCLSVLGTAQNLIPSALFFSARHCLVFEHLALTCTSRLGSGCRSMPTVSLHTSISRCRRASRRLPAVHTRTHLGNQQPSLKLGATHLTIYIPGRFNPKPVFPCPPIYHLCLLPLLMLLMLRCGVVRAAVHHLGVRCRER